MHDEEHYAAYTELLGTLEAARRTWIRRNPQVHLDRDDPDVLRLLEATAYFSARTHVSVRRNFRAMWHRVYHGLFEDLLAPMPACAMLQARPPDPFDKPDVLPRGTEMRLIAANDAVGFFRTTAALPLDPIRLHALEVSHRTRRLKLTFYPTGPFTRPLRMLSLHLEHPGGYLPSLQLFEWLRRHLVRARVSHTDPSGEQLEQALEWPVFGGSVPGDDQNDLATLHPLRRLRAFFHFPEQDLFMHVPLPEVATRWLRMELVLELDASCPDHLELARERFRTHCVPLVNLRREPADPLRCDGTRQRFDLLSPHPGHGFELQSIVGVYRLNRSGPEPIRHGLMPGDGPTWELEDIGDHNTRPTLLLRMPEAFATPCLVEVDGLWHQPGFTDQGTGSVQIRPSKRYLEGVGWTLAGPITPSRDNPLWSATSDLLPILALRMKSMLELDEVRALLRALATPEQGPYQEAIRVLTGIRPEAIPNATANSTSLHYRYHLTLGSFTPETEPLVCHLLKRLETLLDAWATNAVAEFTPSPDDLFPTAHAEQRRTP